MSTKRNSSRPAHAYALYLAAKRTVDDRALNKDVLGILRREAAALQCAKVLEIGAGIGTMVGRLVDCRVLHRADYTLLDSDRQSLDAAPEWLARWAYAAGYEVEQSPDAFRIVGGTPLVDITVRTVCAELDAYLCSAREGESFDLLIANAFLDLVDVPATLPGLFGRLAPGALYWFSINFDGETLFLPEHHADEPLIAIYHRSMDERVRAGKRAGDSRTGRHLFRHLTAAGASILAAGSSDWVVFPSGGHYPALEREFIELILDTIENELNTRADIDRELLRSWLTVRHAQLARGELVYIAHQLDFLGRSDRTAARTVGPPTRTNHRR